jgi:hypothetical protein
MVFPLPFFDDRGRVAKVVDSTIIQSFFFISLLHQTRESGSFSSLSLFPYSLFSISLKTNKTQMSNVEKNSVCLLSLHCIYAVTKE